ncbi:MAG: hypothetical protein WA364_02170 [Candidatus Nitrosopolaris sp.]
MGKCSNEDNIEGGYRRSNVSYLMLSLMERNLRYRVRGGYSLILYLPSPYVDKGFEIAVTI